MDFPKVGNKAPLFSLLNQNNEKISLKDFLGQYVVIYFYPKAMTPGCTTQACGIRDSKKDLQKLNVKVLGISPDEPARLEKFIQRDNLNFDLLSDPEHETADKYGVWGLKKFMGKEYMGINRITFIVNPEGKLVHVMDSVKTKTHHSDVLAIIKDLNK